MVKIQENNFASYTPETKAFLDTNLPALPLTESRKLNRINQSLMGRFVAKLDREAGEIRKRRSANLLLGFQSYLREEQHSECTVRTYMSAVEQLLVFQMFPNRFAPIREALEILHIVAYEDPQKIDQETIEIIKDSKTVLSKLIERAGSSKQRKTKLPASLAGRVQAMGLNEVQSFSIDADPLAVFSGGTLGNQPLPIKSDSEIAADQSVMLRFVFDHFASQFDDKFWRLTLSNPMLSKVKKCFIQKANSSSSINTKFAGIKRFSEYLVLQGLLEHKIDNSLFRVRSRNQLCETEVDLIEDTSIIERGYEFLDAKVLDLDEGESTTSLFLASRDRAMWTLTGMLGFRPMTVTKLSLADVDLKHSLLSVVEKGPKSNKKALIGVIKDSMEHYLDQRKQWTQLKAKSQPLFLNKWRRPMSEKLINRVVHVVGSNIGYPTLAPRDLRSLCFTRLIDEGMPMHEVQELAGHSELKTIQRHYDRRSRSKKALAVGESMSKMPWVTGKS